MCATGDQAFPSVVAGERGNLRAAVISCVWCPWSVSWRESTAGVSFCCIDHDFFGNDVRPKLAVSYRIGSPHPGAITMVLRHLI